MISVTSAFIEAMKTKPYLAMVRMEDGSYIREDVIRSIRFGSGVNAENAVVSVGSTVAGTAEIEVDKAAISTELKGSRIELHIGQALDGAAEWMVRGVYTVTDAIDDGDSIVLTAMDAMATKLDREYEPIEGFNFSAEDGVESNDFLIALCERRGIRVNPAGLNSVRLKNFDPVGCEERKIVGWIAALSGRFAYISRTGVLCFMWYGAPVLTVTADDSYADGTAIADYKFNPVWLKCYNETLEETMTLGDPEGEQGVYFECPWMTDEILSTVWTRVKSLSFYPARELAFFGNPRLEIGDVVIYKDGEEKKRAVPVMAINHEYDGGIVTEISAQGQAKTDAYEGPVQREMKRTIAKIIKKQGEIELSIESLDGDEILARINLSEGLVKVQADKIQLEGAVTANGNVRFLEDGSIEANAGVIGGCVIRNGALEIPVAHITGKLTSEQIDVQELVADDIDMTGRFLGYGYAFLEPGWQEIETMYEMVRSGDYEESYDFDEDGELTAADIALAYKAMVGVSSLANWSGAEKSHIYVTIDPSNPKRAVKITGTNMWGRAVEIYLGADSLFNGPETEKNFNVMLEQSEAFKALAERVEELENA